MNAALEDIYPLAPAQQGFLFDQLSSPETPIYVQQLLIRLQGHVDVARFKTAWQAVASRHAALRTVFVWKGLDDAVQVLLRGMELPLLYEEWLDLPREEQAERLQTLCERDRSSFADLSKAPLLRVGLYRTGNDAYEFVCTQPHILLDGWSMSLVLQELFAAYEQLGANAPVWPSKPASVRDYMVWLKRQDQSRADEFWRQVLSGCRPCSIAALLNGHGNPGRTISSAEMQRYLPPSLAAALQNFCRERRLTLSTVFQGAWALLLSRYTGMDDIIFGATVSTRPESIPGSDRMVGFFLNTLPVRVRMLPALRTGALLEEMQRLSVDAGRHAYCSLSRITGLAGVPGGTPLFDAAFVLENYPMEVFEQGGSASLRIESIRLVERTEYALALQAAAVRGRFSLKLAYDAGHFDAGTIERMMYHFERLLEAMVEAPDTRISELPMLGEGERQVLLEGWSGGVVEGPAVPILELIERQATLQPEAIAVLWNDGELRYSEVWQLSDQLAHRLRRAGVRRESRVGICVDRGPEMVIGVLGIWKAGGAYVPIDPEHPLERQAWMAGDADVSVVVARAAFAGVMERLGRPVVVLERGWSELERESPEISAAAPLADQLAYVIYTSGSTGKPKGVLIPHGGLWQHATALRELIGLGAGERFLLMNPLTFDAAAAVLFPALISGATLFLPEVGTEWSGAGVMQVIEGHGITAMDLPTAVWTRVVEDMVEEDLRVPARLKALVVGGEGPACETLRSWQEHISGPVRFVNAYGPTETTITATAWTLECEPGVVEAPSRIPLGRPVAGKRVYVLDGRLEPTPVGVAGEVYIGGAGVARGYLGAPDLTAEKFIPDPFGGEGGGRLYRTGDIARYGAGGEMEYLGRADEQIKVNGIRIEPGEIEAVLREHEAIQEAAVVPRVTGTGGVQLIAHVVLGQESVPPMSELRRWVQQKLPGWMTPASFVIAERLPLTAHGKVDRAALPAPEQDSGERAYAVPRNPAEETLARIWSDVLGRKQIGIHDNFFELGGDSILSIRIVSRASQAGIHLTPRQVFTNPSVAELVAASATKPHGDAEQGPVTGPAPLTPVQHWFFEQQLAAPDHYNQSAILELRTRVAPGVLSAALGALLEHHDALRLRFQRRGNTVEQWIATPGDDAPFEHIDASCLPQRQRREALDREIGRLQASLDLARGPVVRMALFESGGGEPDRLLIAIHHLAVDGMSWGILLEDLERACEQLRGGGTVQLPPKTSSFRSWAEQLRRYAESDSMRKEAAYWKNVPPAAVWPCAEANISGCARNIRLHLEPTETQRLLDAALRDHRASVQELLLAALTAAYSEITNQSRLLIDIEGHGREELFENLDVSRTVGWFTSIFPVVLTASESRSVYETLRLVKDTLRAVPNRGVGYGILRYLSSDRLPAGPAAAVSFSYLGVVDRELAAESTLFDKPLFTPSQDGRNRRLYPIEVNAFVSGGQLEIEWTYAESAIASEVGGIAERCLERLRNLLAERRDSGETYTPSDFPLVALSRQELDSLRYRYPALADVYPLTPSQSGMLFHGLYEPESEVYFSQLALKLEGPLDGGRMRAAFDRVIARHPILRTAFVWQGLRAPVQVVHRRVDLPWTEFDQEGENAAADVSQVMSEDRQRRFDLSSAPAMRVTLVRRSNSTHYLIWSHHHILLDGWCLPELLREVFVLYAGGDEQQLGPARPYRDYVAWLQRQPKREAEAYWRGLLAGFAKPTLLPFDRGRADEADESSAMGTVEMRLPSEVTAAVQAAALRHNLTLNSVVQGMWAVLLSYYAENDDVVFGSTSSGRPPHLPGVDSIMGLFLNTLPVRIQVDRQQPCYAWMQALQRRLSELREYELLDLPQLRRFSAVPPRSPLFESVVVFENFASHASPPEVAGDLQIAATHSFARNNFPLTLRAVPGSEIGLYVLYDSARLRSADASCIARGMAALLGRFAASSTCLVKEYFVELSNSQAGISPIERAATAAAGGETQSPLPRFGSARRQKVVVSAESLVKVTALEGARELPVLMMPAVDGVNLTQWAINNKPFITERLQNIGGILLRGFNVDSAEEFERFMRAQAGDLAEYRFASTPRTHVAGRVYTSTEYPSDQHIPLHNEMSYAARWPRKIWFWCSEPAENGGETPIADSRRILKRIDPAIVERFRRNGVMYVRNYGEGLDIPWQQVFQTSDRATVEARCREAGIDFEWRGAARLRTREIRRAVATHEASGAEVWFNQAHLFHVSALQESVRTALLASMSEHDVPRNAFYGDGSAIDDSTIDEVRRAYQAETVVFEWQRGDVLMLDNMLVAHGRRPFRGTRRVLVGMAEESGQANP